MQIQTVLGPIGLDDLGRTLMHEHLFIAFPGAEFDPTAVFDRETFVAEATRRLRSCASNMACAASSIPVRSNSAAMPG
jgi:predicted metal-dependent phosphotriesterase family hydrolase